MEDKIACFVQSARRRNIVETVVVIALLALFGFRLLDEPHGAIVTAGRLIIILALLGILVVIWSRLHIPASELVAYPPAEHHDRWWRNLNTQARWLRLAWLWYVLPLLVGIALIMPGLSGEFSFGTTVAAVVVAAVAIGIALLNVQASKRVERKRDAWFAGEDATA